MTRFWVELSGENRPLALAELEGATRALGGAISAPPDLPDSITGSFVAVDLAGRASATALADRLALAWMVVEPWPEEGAEEIAGRLVREGRRGRSAAFRPFGRPRGPVRSIPVARLADAYRRGGGSIDLTTPDQRFFIAESPGGRFHFAEEVGSVDRTAFERRRLPTFPFRRPVSLPPKLGRVAANLGAVRPGDRVLDPFVGTGALAAEAALLGARMSGVDVDATMVRGAIQNLAHVGLEFESITASDAAVAARDYSGPAFDALISDPPYGRSSGSRGEPPENLLERTIPAWAPAVRAGGRIVLVVPG
ncbi:MAG TPA: RsmD family RNA methyltransferase, partial [Thermoplasmata archaeon]|nr:RsmD family RNA methyltransferase [Thermoplasmata archaeon]